MVNQKIKKMVIAVLMGISLIVNAGVDDDIIESIKAGEKALDAGFIDSLIVNKHQVESGLYQTDNLSGIREGITYKILISSAMNKNELKLLLKNYSRRKDVVFVIRGLLPNEKTINDVGLRIINLVKDFKDIPTVQLDPRPFQDVDAQRAPMIIAYQGEEIVNFATGLTSTDYLDESINKGKTGDLGRFGKTVKIAERDIVEIFKERAAKLDTEKLIQQAKDNYWSKATFLNLPEAFETRVRTFEPLITLNEDVAANGITIAAAGTQVNTLNRVPFKMRLVIFDATNSDHIRFVQSLPESQLRTKYITTKFDKSLKWNAIKDVENKIGSSVYQLNRDILTAFDLRVIPSVVTANNKNKQFVISEYSVSRDFK